MSDDLDLTGFGERSAGFPNQPLHEPPPKDEPIAEGDGVADIKAVADHLSERWKAEGKSPSSEGPIVDRRYINHATGEDIPQDKTLSVEEVGRDLGAVHKVEAEVAQSNADADLAAKVDAARTQWHYENNPEFRAQADALIQQQEQQRQAEQTQPQATEAQHPDPAALAEAWKSTPPAIKAALEQQVQQLESAQRSYAQAAGEQAKYIARSIFFDYPELHGQTPEGMQGIINGYSQTDPERALAIQKRVTDALSIAQQAEQARVQQRETDGARWKSYAREQDRIFDEGIAREFSEAEANQIKREVAKVAKQTYGIDQEQLLKEYDSNPTVRDARFQRMMFDAARHRLAMKGIARADKPPAPPVQKPGVAGSVRSGEDAGIARLERNLARSGSIKDAAALRLAKMRARG